MKTVTLKTSEGFKLYAASPMEFNHQEMGVTVGEYRMISNEVASGSTIRSLIKDLKSNGVELSLFSNFRLYKVLLAKYKVNVLELEESKIEIPKTLSKVIKKLQKEK